MYIDIMLYMYIDKMYYVQLIYMNHASFLYKEIVMRKVNPRNKANS